jgi:hypothetical protein
MPPSKPSSAPNDARPVPGETLTRRAVTAITAAVAIMTSTFSIGNVSELCLHLGITAWLAWPIGAAVDLSVTGLLTGLGFLAQHGYTDVQLRKPRAMLLFCGCLTLALNTADAISRRQAGTALVDAVGPTLLIGWSEIGPWMLRQLYTVAAPEPVSIPAQVLPADLLHRARQLDAEHRAKTGRPISRDILRAQLRIARDRAAELVTIIRAEQAPATEAVLPLAA